ncbi:hypothetical protein BBD74_05790 [Salmonella enterica]|nr:hypothetical protein [Salmonella enterica]EBW5467446.1 hypothetical protein [Salmonella enterica subsp. enterica serovar Urbana]EJN2290785.1 hypothetical protein [Salmonella enterica subsp. enterica serovar Anatum]EAY9518529.1 hypothetical protein [Salmonella enterica]EBQ3570108.1 hypothetical protein [Salmonella enterica]
MTLNKYCHALAALRSQPAHELKEVGDQWRTPDLLFWGINAMFGPLTLDLFADDDNAKCPVWFVPADNKQKPTGAFFAGAIAIFDKSWRGERFSYISRTELEEKGKAFMSLVEFAAGKVQPPATTVPEQEEPIVAPAVLPDVDSRIWPLEVGLVFNQVEGADSLDALQQNKLKANINQLWLERTATSEIITAASELVRNMRGEAV